MESGKRTVEIADQVAIKKQRIERPANSLQEKDVGILQYISNGSGFQGLLKQRYSDFQVNEITTEGKVVHLLDEGIDVGKSKKERQMEKRQKERAELQDKTPEEIEQIKEQKKQEADTAPKYELSDENRAKLLEFISATELESIENLFSNGGHTETASTFDDKSKRGKLHQLFRESFQGKLETTTSPENTFRIMIAKRGSGAPRRHPQESMTHVDENGVVNYGLGPFKNYLHFTVYKENRETMEIASTISKFLRIPNKSIRYAGTKDRRGVTCQRMSIQKGKVVRVSALNKALKSCVLGGFAYEDVPLELGLLNGNEFTIAIRDIKPTGDASVEDAIVTGFETLKEKGFINYYGMQRFGTFSVSTHTYGIRLLNEDWKGAVELLLSEQDIVTPESQEARQIWSSTGDASLALKKMPPRCTAEHSILKTLADEKVISTQSYVKAIMSIPRNLRIMYVHAYQSYIWNKVASKRIELFGTELVEGDLVIAEKKQYVPEDDLEEDVAQDTFERARPLTKEDIESGKYSIYDAVLPMPGFDIVYPSNEQLKQVYVEEMGKDGLDPFKMTRKIREFSLAGSYRKLLGRPENVEYSLIKYSQEAEPLIRTDLELLQAKKEGSEPSRLITPDEGDRTAVILKMQLGTSSYATMALREFMKVDTARFGDSLNVTIE